jgi:hypothetical protein
MTEIDDWNDWHRGYDEPGSELDSRLRAVQEHLGRAVGALPPGPVTVLSICGGQGRDLAGGLGDHERRADVRGRLVELDAGNAAAARASLRAADLEGIEVVEGDASRSDAYAGLPPVSVIVVSGVWGHLDDDDQHRTIAFLRQVGAPGAAVVWTSFRRDPQRLERLRRAFRDEGFEEEEFAELEGEEYGFTVATSRMRAAPDPFEPGRTLFTFGSSRKDRSS